MDYNSESDPHVRGSYVEPTVKREDLNKNWIGLGAALEWIALRGQPVYLNLYRDREDEADEALAAALADLPPEIAESIVRGKSEAEPGPLVPIPSGIWPQTATSDANDVGQPYRLIGTEDDDDWQGQIISGDLPGYRRVEIRTYFILQNWPEHALDIAPVPPAPAAAPTAVRRVVEKAISMAGDEITTLSQREMLALVKRCLPNARRAQVRETYAEMMPTPKPGPKGTRNPDRPQHIEELGQKLIAAQLHN